LDLRVVKRMRIDHTHEGDHSAYSVRYVMTDLTDFVT